MLRDMGDIRIHARHERANDVGTTRMIVRKFGRH
jgi:hypothetical protein